MAATAKPSTSANNICTNSGVINGLNAILGPSVANGMGPRQPILNEW